MIVASTFVYEVSEVAGKVFGSCREIYRQEAEKYNI